MMTFNIFKPLLLALLISESSAAPADSSNPVCVIGAGIAGLSAATRLKEKGYNVKVFEKSEDRVGGKMHTFRKDGVVYNMGPILFTENYVRTFDIIEKYGIKYDKYYELDVAGYQPHTGIKLKLPQFANDPLALLAWEKYKKIRQNYKIEPGNVNANPELFVSTSEWLKKNGLLALKPYALFFLTAEGYGHMDDTPALYFIYLLDLNKVFGKDFRMVPDGMDQIPKALAKDLDVTLNAQVSKIERGEHGAKVTYSTSSGLVTQECSSAILAFPPVLKTLNNIIPDLSEEEKSVLGQVRLTKYGTVANYAPEIKYNGYAPILPPPFPPSMDGGIPAAIINQTKGAAVTYHWNRGEFTEGPSAEELAHYQSENDRILPKLFPKDLKTNLYVKGWDYFPHVTTESLQDGFYKKFDSLQGKSNIYYASPLITFEIVEQSIRAGEYIADRFY